MSVAIIRVEKIKTMSQMKGRLTHNYRDRKTPNADTRVKNPKTEYTWKNAYEAFEVAQSRLRAVKKPRRDSVVGLEYVMTSDRKFFDGIGRVETNAWIRKNIEFLEEKHGKSNVVSVNVHFDETTPHIQAIVIPEKNGKLNAKFFTGGRPCMAKLQTDYAAEMAPFRLVRGAEKSKAEHTSIRAYYGQVNRSLEGQEELLQQVSKRPKISRETALELVGMVQHEKRSKEALQGAFTALGREKKRVEDEAQSREIELKNRAAKLELTARHNKEEYEKLDKNYSLVVDSLKTLGHTPQSIYDEAREVRRQKKQERDRGGWER